MAVLLILVGWFCDSLLAGSVRACGHDDWRVRRVARTCLEETLALCERPRILREVAADPEEDPEIRRACRRALSRWKIRCLSELRYDGVTMGDLLKSGNVDRAVWSEANRLPCGDDVRDYCRRMLEEDKAEPASLRRLLDEARDSLRPDTEGRP